MKKLMIYVFGALLMTSNAFASGHEDLMVLRPNYFIFETCNEMALANTYIKDRNWEGEPCFEL